MSCSIGAWVYLTLIMKDGEAELEKWVELPSAPIVGTVLYFHEDNTESLGVEIETVELHVHSMTYWINCTYSCDGECSCTPDDDCCVLGDESSSYLGEWLSCGFCVTRIRRGYDRTHDFRGMFEPEKTLWEQLRRSFENDT